LNIVILGGGNLAHALAVTLSNYAKVSILTSNCDCWKQELTALMPDKTTLKSKKINCFTNPKEVIPKAEIIFSTLPAHIIPSKLKEIKTFVSKNQIIGSVVSSGGFFWIARNILGKKISLFGFHRVPFICRTITKGKSVHISGLKDNLYVAFSQSKVNNEINQKLLSIFEKSFRAKINLLNSYLEATISNSNPILHTSRLFSIIKNNLATNPLYFYKDWDLETSEILLKCDKEIFEIIKKINIQFPLLKSLKEHYEVTNSLELTDKLRSIEAFKEITFPVTTISNKLVPNPSSRYFQEDLAFGLVILRDLADICSVKTPNIDKIILTLQKFVNQEFLDNNFNLKGKDIKFSGIPKNFGINNLKELINLD